MNQDGVSTAFDMILDEIGAVEEQLAAEGAASFKEKRYDAADKLSASGRHLVQFRKKLEDLRAEWRSSIDADTRKRVKVQPGYSIPPHSKGKKTTIRVILPSGRIIQRPTAASSLADVVEEFGLDAVRKLGLTVNGVPLVDLKPNGKYNQEKRGSFFIITHSNTKSKKELIETIAKQLRKSVKVEIV
jgi:hypothetical protein